MSAKRLTEYHLEFLSLTRGCTGSSGSTLVKIPHCRNSHVAALMLKLIGVTNDVLEDIKQFYWLMWFKKNRLETPYKDDDVKG